MGFERAADSLHAAQTHIKDESLIRLDQFWPIQIHLTRAQMTRDKAHLLGVVSVGQRNARIAGAA